uniref:Uncharacterized protein n=1 Tax=Aegilops tauschii subsp. strangulata TaxID=200361 RepID=A0A452YUZ2_AEGTS
MKVAAVSGLMIPIADKAQAGINLQNRLACKPARGVDILGSSNVPSVGVWSKSLFLEFGIKLLICCNLKWYGESALWK